MQVEALLAPGGALMKKEERVLSWVEPRGGPQFFSQGKGVS